MEIFKQLKKLGYKHYIDLTVEKLDALPINSIEKNRVLFGNRLV